jgi:hypothetical protein
MRTRHKFQPVLTDALEARLVLTHGGPIAPGLIGTLSPHPGKSGATGRDVAQVNAAFDQFTANYLQAQGAYLSSGTSADSTAMKAYATQSVQVLAQSLTRTLSRIPSSLIYIKDAHQRSLNGDMPTVLQGILFRKISGDTSSSLVQTLTSNSVIPTTPPTGASASLYTLTATNAIQAARLGMINAVKLLVINKFDNGH